LIVALVAVIAALGVGGYFGYRLLFPETGESTITPPQAPATAPSQPADAAKDSTIGLPGQPAATDSTSTQQPVPVTADEAKSAGEAEAAKSAAGAPKADSTKAKAASPAAPKGTTTAPPAEPAPPRVVAPAGPSSAPPVAGTPSDRWKQMAEAMAQCHREDFFSRVGCEQRVGRRFCDGYWGTVTQCPSGVPKDRGQ